MSPKIKIGCYYEPKQFEHRSATSFSSKMPAATPDSERLQIAVIEDHAHRQRHALTHSTCSVATGLGAIVVALLFGAWAAMQL